MSKTVFTEKELGEELKNDPDEIIIEGDLKNKVIKIKATGKVAWAVCAGCFAIAIPLAIVAVGTGGTSAVVSASFLVPATAVLGISTVISVITIGVAGGGLAVLNNLRKYKIKPLDSSKILLSKK